MKNRDPLQSLIGRYVDQIATPAEVVELENILHRNPAARREFLRYLATDTALTGAALTTGISRAKTCKIRSKSRFSSLLRMAAAALVLASLSILPLWRNFVTGTRSDTQGVKAFATLSAATHALWSDPNTELSLRAGLMPQGLMRLESGTVEFLCRDGATVTLRGPAAFEFPEQKVVFLESGRIHCRCPSPESRLTVTTPATQIQDLGTEFAVEARSDRSTRVAVLSGEVQIGKPHLHRLRKGQAMELRGDGILAINALSAGDFSEFQITASEVLENDEKSPNLLSDPGFDYAIPNALWNGTEHNITSSVGGRSGNGVRVMARGIAHWPQCHQTIHGENIPGSLVVASAWAAVCLDDPLRGNQTAMLKIAFKNAEGRDFAFVCKRFLGPHSQPGRFEKVEIAAFAPPGTVRLQVQLMLQADGRDRGSIIFDDAFLRMSPPAASR